MSDRQKIILRHFRSALIFLLAYSVTFQIGRGLYFVSQNVTVFWLSNGLVIGVLLMYPRRAWPVILLLQATVQFYFDISYMAHALTFGLLSTFANLASELTVAWLIQRFLKETFNLSNIRQLGIFVLAIMVGEGIGALIGATAVSVTYAGAPFGPVWLAWLASDFTGMLLVVPVVVGMCNWTFQDLRKLEIATIVEGIVVFLSLGSVTLAIFSARPGQATSVLDFPYLVVPFLFWAAVRFHPRFVALANLMVGLMIAVLAARLLGPFIVPGQDTKVMVQAIQIFLVVLSLSTLMIATIVLEREQIGNERDILITQMERKNTELETFMYAISHDLKGPLVTISAFIGQLKSDLDTGAEKQIADDLDYISTASEQMQRLLEDLLQLSAVDHHVLQPESVDFKELFNEAMIRLDTRTVSGKTPIGIVPDTPAIYCDRVRMAQVLAILLDNAMKFKGATRKPRIEAGFDSHVESGAYFVRDNGMGILDLYHNRIFNLFEQLDPDSEGSGIGLALARHIIQLHRGRLWVVSEPGQGSTFYFTSLPQPEA